MQFDAETITDTYKLLAIEIISVCTNFGQT
jgi:hypothetical protein